MDANQSIPNVHARIGEHEETAMGELGSLLEGGTGFHPELTGRENVYLGAGLFGLTRKEIDRQFDAIVAFAWKLVLDLVTFREPSAPASASWCS